MSQPVLSICIPIYNRSAFLERMLSRFLEDRDLFEEKIHLLISDNCSEEDLGAIVEKYSSQGLHAQYRRNDENIGGDRNICACFRAGIGKYTWVLGSDDIPVAGLIRQLVCILETTSCGLLHLNDHDRAKSGIVSFSDAEDFFVAMQVWITFISANIIRTEFIAGYEFEKYVSTSLSQVPLFLKAGFESGENLMYYTRYLEDVNDAAGNGGYNVFVVFADNLLSFYENYVRAGHISVGAYGRIKRSLYRNFLAEYVLNFLILRRNSNFDIDSGWSVIKKHYGGCVYVVTDVVELAFRFGFRRLSRAIRKQLPAV